MKCTDSIAGVAPNWASGWLFAAGVYNLAWGTSVIVWPHWLFDAAGLERMNYPEIWQCVGMIVGVYGLGYLIAATRPRTHWPIVLVGLLGKIFGPIGFAFAMARGVFPPLFGLTILSNDLVWWIPFCMILRDAWRSRVIDRRAGDLPEQFVREVRNQCTAIRRVPFPRKPRGTREVDSPVGEHACRRIRGLFAGWKSRDPEGTCWASSCSLDCSPHRVSTAASVCGSTGVRPFCGLDSPALLPAGRSGRDDPPRRSELRCAVWISRTVAGGLARPSETGGNVRLSARSDEATDRVWRAL